ncbi:MAG: ATP synthase F1 subunit epsilon [Alphaproteobacteria bacterium]|nr:MAG: ATP synthase F1 subunit epsilon [Alphaproteobacteria bacterium]
MAESFQLDIIAPDKTLLSEPVQMVVIPGTEGDFGVLAKHAPFLSTLRPGIIKIQPVNNNDSETLFISGGFAAVENNHCTILADYAIPAKEIKREQVVSRIENITKKLQEDPTQDTLITELKVCEAMLAVAA